MNDAIVSDNLGLVYACANRFRGRGAEYDDLFQAGCLGLVKAAENFDSERGVKFSTYAVPVILGEIKRIFRDGGTVKVGRTLKETAMKVSRETAIFTAREGREPTVSELAAALDISSEKVTEAVCASQHPVSLTTFDSDSDDSGGSQLDLPIESHEEKMTDLIALRQILLELEDNDRKIIYLRFFNNKTQSKTAEELCMTQVQVSRREKKILSKMRERMLG